MVLDVSLIHALFFCLTAQSIWEIGQKIENPHEFAVALDHSDMGGFGFTDDFIFDLWGSISDAKQGRLKKTHSFDEQF